MPDKKDGENKQTKSRGVKYGGTKSDPDRNMRRGLTNQNQRKQLEKLGYVQKPKPRTGR